MLLERLEKHTGLSGRKLEWYAATASKRYKVYTIPKRTTGFRTIEHPSREIKAIQRWLNRALIRRFPVHSGATAYSKGSSIKDNAARHANSSFTLHADFEAFFPSFDGSHVEKFVLEKMDHYKIELSTEDITFFRRMVCRHNVLTIGAPSSPILTNAMMYDFDAAVSNWCASRNLIYSRYADDLFISSNEPNALSDALVMIENCASNYRFARLRLNHKKTAFLSRRYRRAITGIVITPTHELSIGRDRKLSIKSDVYKYQQGCLPRGDLPRVRGMISFVRDVEPTFYETLIRKYGTKTLDNLVKMIEI